MGFRLTVLLAAAIFLAMYFAPAPEPRPRAVVEAPPPVKSAAPDPAPAAPQAARIAGPEPAEPAAAAPRPAPPDVGVPAAPPVPGDDLLADDGAADAADADLPGAVVPGLGLGALRPADSGDALGLVDAVRQQTGVQTARPVDLTRPGIGATAAAPPPPPGAGALPRALVLGSAVNLRAGPSTATPVVGQLDFGDEVAVTVEDPAEGWTGIRHPQTGATVYVASRFLQIQP
ncbi:MAG: SH3 domain-containing protein [Rhodobacteraceae bacterium]|nr:SH3 domain-containing protein [Paracoccaceae bacterium]